MFLSQGETTFTPRCHRSTLAVAFRTGGMTTCHAHVPDHGLSALAFVMELDDDTDCSILSCRTPSAPAPRESQCDDDFAHCAVTCYSAAHDCARTRDGSATGMCRSPRDCSAADAAREARSRARRSRGKSRMSRVQRLHLPRLPAATGLNEPEFDHAAMSASETLNLAVWAVLA